MISQFNLFRYVEGETVVHRADARVKVLGLTVLIFVFSFSPGWIPVAIVWSLGGVLFLAAKLPLGVVPRPPRIILYAIAFALFFAFISGGDPIVNLAGFSLELGGVILQIRFILVTLGLLFLSLLIGWTTPSADLPRAASWMLRPFRALRLPVDELVAALTLAVRALPLVADEFATVTTLWRSRPSQSPLKGLEAKLVQAMDVAATVTAASVRRATELGQALEQRGPMVIRHRHPRWTLADAAIGLLIAAVCVAIWFSPNWPGK